MGVGTLERRSLFARIGRLCIPALLWTVVGIAAPAFLSQIRHSDRAAQEDFAVYYLLARELREGVNPYSNNVIEVGRRYGMNIHGIVSATDPPTFLVAIMGPLTYLPLHTAYWIWQAANLLCLLVALYLLIGPGSGLSAWATITFTGMVALYPPVASHFWFGQSKFILLLLLVLTMRGLERGRIAAAGGALALAILVRIFPIVMAGYLVLTRRWRALGWTAMAMIVGIVVTVQFAGWRHSLDFIQSIPTIGHAAWNLIQRDLAAPVFISRQLRAFFPAGNAPVMLGAGLTIAVDLAILVLTTMATLALPANEDPDSRIFSLWVATAVFLLPVAWDYDLNLMLIPFAKLAVAAARGVASRRAIAMAMLSYGLLVWWEYVALSANEFGFLALLAAYLSAYWLAVDQPGPVRLPLTAMPGAIWRRLLPTA